MIIVRIIGGLGNQLFQYSYGKYLAAQLDTDLYMDLTAIEAIQKQTQKQNFTTRQFDLNYFEKIKVRPIENRLIARLNHSNIFVRRLARYSKPLGFKYLHQQGLLPLKTPRNKRKDYYLNGYFVGFLPVDLMREEILREFSDPLIINEQFHQLKSAIQSAKNPVFIHVRRGDYFTKHFDEFGICDEHYYQRAIDRMQALISDQPDWFVFSDDSDWVKAHLNLPTNTIFATDFQLAGHEDLSLMSQCRHGVISNSTFSWWGAWLITNEDKVIVSPDRWFKQTSIPWDINDIIPPSWQRVQTKP